MTAMASVSRSLNIRYWNGLVVTMVMAMMVVHGWAMITFTSVIWHEMVIVSMTIGHNVLHVWAMMIVTAMIFWIISYRKLDGLAMIMVMAVIGHYGLAVISSTTVMVSAADPILHKMRHN